MNASLYVCNYALLILVCMYCMYECMYQYVYVCMCV